MICTGLDPGYKRLVTDESADPREATTDESKEAALPGEEAAPAPPPDPVAEARAEAQKFRDQLLRTAADFDNFRKRTRKELTDSEHRGREEILKELLPVFDNLERAMQHADSATDVQALVDGLRMVAKQFTDTLGKVGIQRVTAVGLPFDPALHEAIQHLESAEHPAGVVLAEVQSGYRHGDRLLRPALVVVSKGAPAAEEPAKEQSD